MQMFLYHVFLADLLSFLIVRKQNSQLPVEFLLMIADPQMSQFMMENVSYRFTRHGHTPVIHDDLPAVFPVILDAAAPSGLVETVLQGIVRNRIQQFITELVNEVVQDALGESLEDRLSGIYRRTFDVKYIPFQITF